MFENTFEKMIFDVSPHNTIRMWMYFDQNDYDLVVDKFSKQFNYLSCWGAADKVGSGMLSWEFPISLVEFFFEKYSCYQCVDVEYLRKYLGK